MQLSTIQTCQPPLQQGFQLSALHCIPPRNAGPQPSPSCWCAALSSQMQPSTNPRSAMSRRPISPTVDWAALLVRVCTNKHTPLQTRTHILAYTRTHTNTNACAHVREQTVQLIGERVHTNAGIHERTSALNTNQNAHKPHICACDCCVPGALAEKLVHGGLFQLVGGHTVLNLTEDLVIKAGTAMLFNDTNSCTRARTCTHAHIHSRACACTHAHIRA